MTDFDAVARTWDDPQKVERARRVADAIAAAVPGLAGMAVFEFGSGTGLLGLELLPRVAWLTMADRSREMLAVAREKLAAAGAVNAEVMELDLATQPGPARRYQLVCTLLTLHHVPDVDGVLARFHELLAPGGVLCVADLEEEDGSFHGAGAGVHHGFRSGDLARRLERAGFEEVRISRVVEIEKDTAAGRRRFPVFLAVARRKG